MQEARDAMEKGPLKLYSDHGYGPYRVALADSDEAIGICGLFRRDNLDDPDIGFAILPDHCGKGYAFEAADIVSTHAREGLGLKRITAIVSRENNASIGLIERLGLTFERMLLMPGDDEKICLYAIDWGKAD